MADNEKKVTFRAVGNFTSFNRAVDAAIRRIDKLKRAQAELNASSAATAGSLNDQASSWDKAAKSAGRHAKATDQDATSAGKHAAAMSAESEAAERVAQSLGRGASAANKFRAEQDNANKAIQQFGSGADRASRAADATASASGRATSASERLARAFDRQATSSARAAAGHRRQASELGRLQVSFNNTLTRAQRLKSGLDKVGNWRPRLTPPFIALIPLIAGVVAAINPLVAGLGAVSAAALGFGSSLGTLAGSAIGVIPALSALLGVVASLKVAFGGIGGAFKAAGKVAAAGGGGGGSSAPKQAELTMTEKIARAQENYRRAIQDVSFAEEDLDDARKDYIDRVKELQKAVDRAAASQARAAANSRLAQENYANVLADPGSTKGQKMDASAQIDEAKNDYQDVVEENKKNAKDLAALRKTGINGDRQVIQAQRALTDAINGVRDAQLALANAAIDTSEASSAAAGAADEYAAALAKLSPSARSVVEQLVAMRGAWEKLQRTVQESFFSKIVDDIQLLRRLFPPVTKLLSNLAGTMGTLSSLLIRKVTGDSWISDIYKFADESVKPVNDVGMGLLSWLDAFKDLTIAALPFLTSLAEGFKQSAANFADLVATARQDGSLAAYLERVRSKMSQWWRIVKNIGSAIMNYGRAAGDFGDWLTDGFERVTKGWADNAKAATKAGSPFRQYLNDIRPLVSNLNGLLGDFFKWIGKTATNKKFIDQMNDIVTIFRDQIGPAIGDILDVLSDTGVSVALTDALASLAELIDTILKNGGAAAIKNFFKAVDAGFKALSDFASIPGVGGILTVLFQGLAGLAAISFVGKFTGLTAMLGLLIKAGRSSAVRRLFGGIRNLARGGAGAGAAAATGAAASTGGAAASRAAAGGAAAAMGGGSAYVAGALGRGAARARVVGGDAGPTTFARGSGLFGRGTPNITSLAREAGPAAKVLAGISKAGKFLIGGVGGLASLGGAIAGGAISDSAAQGTKGSTQRVTGNIVKGASTGAGIGATIGSAVPGVGTAAGAVVGGAIGGATGFFTSSKEDKKKFLDDLGNFFSKDVPAFFQSLGSSIWDGLTTFGGWLAETWESAKEWLANAPENIAYAIGFLWGKLQVFGGWLAEKWVDAKVWLAGLPDRIAATAQDVWRFLKDLPSWLSEKWVAAKAWLAGLPQRVANTAKNIWANLKGFATWLSEKWTSAKTWVQGLPQRIADAAGDVWAKLGSIGGWLAKQGGKVKTWAQGLAGNIGDWVGDIGGAFRRGEKDAKGGKNRHYGGPIKRAGGGGVPGSGNSDTVPAMLTPGEFVLRRAIVNRIGEDNLARLNSGVLTYAQLLQKAQQENKNSKASTPGFSGSGMGGPQLSFFNAGGLAPKSMGTTGLSDLASKQQNSNDYSMNFGNVIINNPIAEKSSDSIPKAIRRTTSLGALRRDTSND